MKRFFNIWWGLLRNVTIVALMIGGFMFSIILPVYTIIKFGEGSLWLSIGCCVWLLLGATGWIAFLEWCEEQE